MYYTMHAVTDYSSSVTDYSSSPSPGSSASASSPSSASSASASLCGCVRSFMYCAVSVMSCVSAACLHEGCHDLGGQRAPATSVTRFDGLDELVHERGLEHLGIGEGTRDDEGPQAEQVDVLVRLAHALGRVLELAAGSDQRHRELIALVAAEDVAAPVARLGLAEELLELGRRDELAQRLGVAADVGADRREVILVRAPLSGSGGSSTATHLAAGDHRLAIGGDREVVAGICTVSSRGAWSLAQGPEMSAHGE